MTLPLASQLVFTRPQVMFDFKPDFDPPFVDGSVFRLYDYFDENPELGDLPAEVSGLRVSVGEAVPAGRYNRTGGGT